MLVRQKLGWRNICRDVGVKKMLADTKSAFTVPDLIDRCGIKVSSESGLREILPAESREMLILKNRDFKAIRDVLGFSWDRMVGLGIVNIRDIIASGIVTWDEVNKFYPLEKLWAMGFQKELLEEKRWKPSDYIKALTPK